MNKENLNSDDAKLRSLLRESRAAPLMPPRFQENVWRRIADSKTAKSADTVTWLDSLIALVLRPRLAFAALTMLVIAGAAIGAHEGSDQARHNAQVRYMAAVAPNPLH